MTILPVYRIGSSSFFVDDPAPPRSIHLGNIVTRRTVTRSYHRWGIIYVVWDAEGEEPKSYSSEQLYLAAVNGQGDLNFKRIAW